VGQGAPRAGPAVSRAEAPSGLALAVACRRFSQGPVFASLARVFTAPNGI